MAAYYPQPQPSGLHAYQYYSQPPPPPPPGAPPPAVPQLHPQYVTHQPHSFASYGPPIPPLSLVNQVRTLFIAGLPEDVNPREIYNLFREFPGYESSHLRSPTETSQPFAFAVFANQQSAIVAMHALNGMVFDLEQGSTLYVDLAKSNSKSKRTRIDDERIGSDKKARGSALSRATHDSGVGSNHMPGMGNSAYNTNTIGYPSAQSYGNVDGKAVIDSAVAYLFQVDSTIHLKLFLDSSALTEPHKCEFLQAKCVSNPSNSRVPQNATPCPTLFVANMGPSCTEQELIQVFSRCPGFLKLKVQSTYGPPVAFVDFQDVASSTGALNSLQGTILYSSPEGMRLEYAKSRMGMRRKPK